MRKPSPATIIASAALFVALGSAGVAVNAPVAGGKSLQVANTSAKADSTALGLSVAAGQAPFTVNSQVKVANLNADLLDGKDSSAFLATGGMTISYAGLDAVAEPPATALPDTDVAAEVDDPSAGPSDVVFPIDIPTHISGRPLKLKSAQVCFGTTAGASITSTAIIGGPGSFFNDPTTRTAPDGDCYSVTPGTPLALGAGFGIFLDINFSSAQDYLVFSGGTVTLTT